MPVTYQYDQTHAAHAPFSELLSITPSNSATYSPPLRGLIVTASGDIQVETENGDSDITFAATAGQLIPALITQVKTGTTATVLGGR